MLKFVAMQNVERFRAELNNETHPERRILLQRLLVEEEDKLGATFERLASVQRAINAKARLETLMASRVLHDSYCRKLESKLYQGPLLGAQRSSKRLDPPPGVAHGRSRR